MLFICSLSESNKFIRCYFEVYLLWNLYASKKSMRYLPFRSSLTIFNHEKVEIHFYYLHCLFNFTFHFESRAEKKSVTKYVDSASNWIARELLHVMFRLFIHSSFIPYSIFFCLWRVIIESFGGSKWKKKQFVPVGAHGNGCITTYSVVQFDFLYIVQNIPVYWVRVECDFQRLFSLFNLCYIHKNIRSKL